MGFSYNKEAVEAQKKQSRANRTLYYQRAQQYAKEYDEEEKLAITLSREAKFKGGFYVEPEAKLLFIIRIRGLNAMHPKTRSTLQLLRLRQIFSGVFLKVNKATLNMLHRVELLPLGTFSLVPVFFFSRIDFKYGLFILIFFRSVFRYLNFKSVRELIYKRGFGKVGKQRIPLTDNAIVEMVLGKHRIICMEDLINEIITVGPHFKEANNFLWPFQLSAPLAGLKKKKNHVVEGGDVGNRENFINQLIWSMQ